MYTSKFSVNLLVTYWLQPPTATTSANLGQQLPRSFCDVLITAIELRIVPAARNCLNRPPHIVQGEECDKLQRGGMQASAKMTTVKHITCLTRFNR
jgi:hypothetical protein